MLVVLRFTSGGVFVERFEALLRPHLYQYFQYVNKEIGNPPNLETAKQLSEKLKVRIIIHGPDLHWSSDGVFPRKKHLRLNPRRGFGDQFESGRYRRQLAVRLSNPPYTTLFFTQKNSELPSAWRLLFGTLLGIFLVLGLLYFLLRRMISPLKTIQQGVKKIGAGDLEHRISLDRKDELGDLSHEINNMADDIQNMLEAKRQLLLAISHELRSPITRAKVATSLMENDKLKGALEDDLNEMEVMVSGLLEAERLNNRHQALQLTKVNINALIAAVLTKHFSDQVIKFDVDNALGEKKIDEARFQFIIKNLLENALKYRKNDQDEVIISTYVDQKSWKIIVEDHGIGIPQKHLSHLTEPFYRVDPSRHRETGGYGLGLYIIKMIVEAHQGILQLESVEGEGLKVTISLSV